MHCFSWNSSSTYHRLFGVGHVIWAVSSPVCLGWWLALNPKWNAWLWSLSNENIAYLSPRCPSLSCDLKSGLQAINRSYQQVTLSLSDAQFCFLPIRYVYNSMETGNVLHRWIYLGLGSELLCPLPSLYCQIHNFLDLLIYLVILADDSNCLSNQIH